MPYSLKNGVFFNCKTHLREGNIKQSGGTIAAMRTATRSITGAEVAAPAPQGESVARYEHARYLAFAFCTADALLETDSDGGVLFASGATRLLFGTPPEAMTGCSLEAMSAEGDRPLLRALLARAAAGERFQDVPVGFSHDGGADMLVSLNGYGVPDLGDHYFITARAVPADRGGDGADLLSTEAFSDTVKAHFEGARGDAGGGELTFIGLTGLPELEEKLGIAERQVLQRRLGAFLQAVSLEGGSVAQLGDDRFGLLHDPALDIGGVEGQLRQFTRDADPDGVGVAVEAKSAAVDTLEAHGKELAQALLYTIQQVAQEGGDAAQALSGNIGDQLGATAQNIAQVRETIDTAQFDIAYQSIVSLADRKTHHFEALVRLGDSSSDMNPYDFVCFAEDVGLIASFDIALCRKLIRRIKSAASRGDILSVAANISGRSIGSDVFVEELRTLLTENPGVHGKLMFEITETARIVDLPRANAVLQSFRDDGFAVSLDDFGAGEAAFEYLRALDVDFVKIDGQYVIDAATSTRDRAFLAAMAGLCRDLDIDTIAEYVETETTRKFLQECGIGYGQGSITAANARDLARVFVRLPDKHGENFDFHPAVGSPLIDAGIDLKVANDRDNKPRPVGKAPDIGPYEAQPRPE